MTSRYGRALPLAYLAAAVGCTDVKAVPSADLPRAPRQVMAAIDISGSRSAHELAEGRAMLERVIDGLSYRDRVVLLEMHERGVRDGRRSWADTMPSALRLATPTAGDRQRLENAREAARAVIPIFFDSARLGRVPATDILATLQTVGEYRRDAGPRRPVLVLLSDMLQSAGGIEMSRPSGVPGPEWVRSRKEAGLLPPLEGVCVLVIGADASTRHGLAVKQFWREYLAAAGAELDDANYRRTVTPGAPLGCD